MSKSIKDTVSTSFIISNWYRPPNSKLGLFDNFESFLFKCDLENKELILVGGINCDFCKIPSNSHSRRLQFLCCIV